MPTFTGARLHEIRRFDILGLFSYYRPRNLGRCNLLLFRRRYAMKKLQAKLNRLAENLNSPVAVILEGRDTAGKSSTIRKLTHYLPPDLYSVCLSHKPSKRAMSSWLGYWETKLPQQNQIVFFDRSWYSRAMVQHLNQWCTPKQYEIFMRDHKNWEANQPVR